MTARSLVSSLVRPVVRSLVGAVDGGGAGNPILGTFTVDNATPTEGDTVTFTLSITSVHGELSVDDATPASGAAVTFTWAETLEIAWLKDGETIVGESGLTLAVADWVDADNGSYSVVATDTRTGRVRTFSAISVATTSTFFRPNGVDTYLRPDGTSEYRRAA